MAQRRYGDAIANAERQVEQGERKVQALAARIDSVREQHAQLRTEEGKLQQKAEQQQQSLDEFNQLVRVCLAITWHSTPANVDARGGRLPALRSSSGYHLGANCESGTMQP